MKKNSFISAELCLLILVFANVVSAQNHVQTISVTNEPTTITADGNYNQVLVREKTASPSAAFSVTLTGTSTALNYPAGTQFLFTGNFVNGQAIGTIQTTTAGPFTFIAVEASGPPSMSVKNTILSGGSSGNATSIQGLSVSSTAPSGVQCLQSNSGDTSLLFASCSGTAGITNFSAGNLSPLFTSSVATATSTPALTFTLSNAAANSVFGNCTGSSAAPSYCSITGAMLPNPGASSLGGIESLASTSHQWINAISTSGVPSSTQPALSDLTATFSSPLSLSTNALSCPTCVTSASALTNNLPVIGQGGQATAGGTVSGNTTEFVTTTGTQTSGNAVTINGSVNHIAAGFAPGHKICVSTSTSDILLASSGSGEGSFATTCSIPTAGLAIGGHLHIVARGVYTTTSTSAPKLNLEVNAGNTTGVCNSGTALTLSTSISSNAGTWVLTCDIFIATTGAPGTAIAQGEMLETNGATTTNTVGFGNGAATVNFTTSSAQTVSIQQTFAMVSGQTANLTALAV